MAHISAIIVGCLLTMFIFTGLFGAARYCLLVFLRDQGNQSIIFCSTVVFFYWIAMTVGAWLLFFGYFGLIPLVGISFLGVVPYLLHGQFPRRTSGSVVANGMMRAFPVGPIGRSLFITLLLVTIFTCIRAVLAPIHGWDASTYHLPKSVWWVKNGMMTLPEFPGGWEFHKYEFGAVELLHALIMIPFGTPLLVNLPDVLAYILCGIVSLLIVDQMMPGGKARYLGLIMVLSSPTLKMLVGSCYVELHAALLVLCAFLPLGEFFISRNYRYLYVVSAGVGCLVASKILFLPLALAYGGFLLYCFFRQRIGLFCLVIAFTMASLPVLPWGVHNFLCTGNPVAPFPLKLFGFSIFEGHVGLQHLIDLGTLIDTSFSAELAILGKIAFESGLVFIAASYFYLRTVPSVWWWISCVLLVFTFGAFYRPEMSIVRLVWGESRLVVAGIIPAVLVGSCSRSINDRPLGILITIALVQNLVVSVRGVAPFEYPVVAGGACIILGGIYLSRFYEFKRVYLCCSVTLIAFILYTSWVQHYYYSRYLQESSIYNDEQRYWADAVLRVYTGGPYRIAVATGLEARGDNQKLFPFFGENLQNSLVYVSPSADGKGIYPLKENHHYELDAGKWKERLKRARVTHVMSYYPLAFELPILEQDAASFERLEGGEGWGLYAVNYDNKVTVAP